MAESTKQFFERLAVAGRAPGLEGVSGTMLIEIVEEERTERWYITFRKGAAEVSRKGAAADCRVSADAATFGAIVAGRMNAMAAVLRGVLRVEGKIVLLASLQRLFAAASSSGEGREVAGYAGRGT
jgi:putative sterol carrier protein